jgi:TonB family protein
MNRALIALLLTLCSVPSPTQTPDDYLHSLIGQRLLLRHFGNVTEVKLKAAQLGKIAATCDVAVLVRAAGWKKDKVTFRWEEIGTPQVAGKPYPQCPGQNMGYGAVEIGGFNPGESSESLARSLSALLQTPEQYLAAAGIVFDLPPQPVAGELKEPEQPFIRPRALLSVDPTFSEAASKAKYQGVLKLRFYVGSDGRVYNPSVSQRLGMGLDEMALEVLPLWRLQPARKQDQPVATPMSIEISFNIY